MTAAAKAAQRRMYDAELAVQRQRRLIEQPGGVGSTRAALDQALPALVALYWVLVDEDRRALLGDYLRVLRSIKMVADDVFLEGFAAAASLPTAQRAVAEDDVHDWYLATVERWIRASPAVERKVEAKLRFPNWNAPQPSFMLGLGVNDSFDPRHQLTASLLDKAARAIEAEVSRARQSTAPQPDGFSWMASKEPTHVLGIAYLLIQMDLMDKSHVIPPASEIKTWYRILEQRIETMRTRVLDVIVAYEREALSTGNRTEVDGFRRASLSYFAELAATYTMRSQEMATLWTFVAVGQGAHPSLQRRIVAPDGATELLTALHGQQDPDNQQNAGALTVDRVIAEFSSLHGSEIRVFGKRTSGVTTFRLSNLEGTRVLSVEPSRLLLLASDAKFVVVTGRLGGTSAQPIVDATRVDEFRVPYVSRVGMNIDLFGQPLWRTNTKALVAAFDEEKRSDSLSEATVEQLLLEADLLRFAGVRRLATAARPNRIDLRDRKLRVAAWREVWTTLSKVRGIDVEARILDLEQRYLRAYTRHTFWNIRDSGPNYLDSTWPADLALQAVHDCGVYALDVAWDLFLTVEGVPGRPRIEFTLLATPDHLTMLAVIGDRYVVVNNRDLAGPDELPKRGEPRNKRIDAATFQAVGKGYQAVHRYRFNVVPFIQTKTPIATDVAPAVFKKDIWKAFLEVATWGLEPTTPNATYWTEMQSFDDVSRRLGEAWPRVGRGALNQPADPVVTTLTDAAKDLFDQAELLVTGARFIGKSPGTCGVSLTADPRLPMYVVADDLKAAGKRGAPLTQPQRDLAKRLDMHQQDLVHLWCP